MSYIEVRLGELYSSRVISVNIGGEFAGIVRLGAVVKLWGARD